jgi:glutathione S-transferase
VATLRFWFGWIGEANFSDVQRTNLPGKRAAGEAALKLMDEHLTNRDWFVGNAPTLADICLFPYTHVAGDGGFDLNLYPAIQAWIARVANLPRFIPMDA